MKILGLQFLAFGPFTNLCLDLSGGDHGLHVLFGPNEAGKSSALRALRALLYGIPNQTADNFLHDNPRLRLGGHLCHSDGTELRLIRRKGLKNTLMGCDEHPISEAALGKFLAGVSQELFCTMFGLDHPALRQGGQDILQGGGEVGQSLFSAALGGVSLRHIQQSLDHEARQLFLPRGDNPRINKSLAAYKAVKRTIEEHSLAGGKWAEHTRAYEEALGARQVVAEELAHLVKEHHRLGRLQLAIPKIARRQELLAKSREYHEVVLLPPEFAELRREALQHIEQARETEKTSRRVLEQLSSEQDALVVPDALLAQAEAITLLQQRLGSYQKAIQERSRLLGQRRQLDTDLQSLLAKLPPGLTLERLKARRLQAAQRARVQELARQYQARVDRADRAMRDVQKYTQQSTKITEALDALTPPRDSSALRQAVLHARQQGDLEGACAQLRTARQIEREQAQVEIIRLGCWSGTLEELERLHVPSREAVDQYEATFSRLNGDAGHLNGEIQKAQRELVELDRQLAELRLSGAVPSEEDLARARRHRDEVWHRVRCSWLDGEAADRGDTEALENPHDLASTYTDSVTHADALADRLRREAERVTRQAGLQAQHEKSAKILSQLTRQQATLEAEQRQQRQQWHDIWRAAGIIPLSPREMRPWLDRHAKLLGMATHLRESQHQLSHMQARVQESMAAIGQALHHLGGHTAPAGETLEALLVRSEAAIERIDEAARQRRELQHQLVTATREVEGAARDQRQAAKELAHWQTDWTAVIVNLGLDSTALPVEASAIIEVLHELAIKQDGLDTLTQRIESIDHEAQIFTQEVADLTAQVAPDLAGTAADQAAVQLLTRLVRAQTDTAKASELGKQIAIQQANVQKAQATITRMAERLQSLCRQAHCTNPDELPAAEIRSAARRQLQEDLAALETQLLEQSAGATIKQLLEQAAAIDADLLPGQLDSIDRRIRELEEQRSSLEQAIGREREILTWMDGSSRAADTAEQAQALLAELHEGVERYVRVRLASMLLRREIERYRAGHQGPLLQRASALFSQLTLGSFACLETDYNDMDQPVLVGLRADGRRAGVEGMSDGTRDQLYLSLRLASLERYLAHNEPMPFIVDDILIQFDDQRAKAALSVLAELSRQTQVIFFTHHWRLAELAQGIDDQGAVRVQSLKT
jgi:uncharacterized protein YhaN